MNNDKLNDFFKENLKNKDFSNLNIKNIDLIDKEKYLGDLTPIISCVEDYYEDMLKVYETQEKVLEIDSDKYLEITGSGILYLIVNQDSNLFLDIKSLKFESLFIKILVKENVKLNLINYNNGENLFTNFKILQKNNSKIEHLVFNVNIKQNINESNLFENSNYNLEGINYSLNNEITNFNSAIHLKDNSNSDIKFNCYTFNSAIINCKTKTRIEKNTKNCIGHQKAQGLILSLNSKINCEPILEILSNEVISSHSASVSKIFEDTKYYLMTRGMSENQIKNFIVKNRFEFLIEKIEIQEFKEILINKIKEI